MPTSLIHSKYPLKTPDNPNGEIEPQTVAELVASFLMFIAEDIVHRVGTAVLLCSSVLSYFLGEFERNILQGENIHSVASSLPGVNRKTQFIRAYYVAIQAADATPLPHKSALLRAAANNRAKVYATFGGQGSIEGYFDEFRRLCHMYPSFSQIAVRACSDTLLTLSQQQDVADLFPSGLDIEAWLMDSKSTPSSEISMSIPVSLPLIGLLQLATYAVTYKVLGYRPSATTFSLAGITGHSQGIVVAAAIASSNSWSTFKSNARDACTILFWIGVRSQQAWQWPTKAPLMAVETESYDEGYPSPLLSVRGLPLDRVELEVVRVNQFVSEDRSISIAVHNGRRNFVVAGPVSTLQLLNRQLWKLKAPDNLNQSRIPFSKRKPRYINRLLPATAPFHTKYLADTAERIIKDVQGIEINSPSLCVPLFDTFDGQNVRSDKQVNLVPWLVRRVTIKTVFWEKATIFPKATHILSFRPGRISGIGFLTSRNKEGSGVRVILADSLDDSNSHIGNLIEVYQGNHASQLKYGIDWSTYKPRLIKSPDAVMHAGYTAELAAGGLHSSQELEAAIKSLQHAIPLGCGILINLIYANPRALAWQIPLITRLRKDGAPIHGITIGADVSSLEIVNEYIATMGLRYICFKAGNAEAIREVIAIVRAASTFPIVYQWTGGRGGGHHSYEDFHEPILQTYDKIRQCQNLVLVAGSGFGNGDSTYPYFSGEWSQKFGYLPMPFDGCLFGSRMMTAAVSHTSADSKQAIVAVRGLEDDDWEKTMDGAKSDIISVRSEMGQPIHKIATRGVKLWAEMDAKIFSLPRSELRATLQKEKKKIISRLNSDFQKVWFGLNSAGEVIDLEEMTHIEVIARLISLLYVKHQRRWIHSSYQCLIRDSIFRTEERFFTDSNGDTLSVLVSIPNLDHPDQVTQLVLSACPRSKSKIITTHDTEYFIMLCQRREQKQVSFVPRLDENFETWFKKDSLWQSEDLDAVVGQDVQRVCILHGPVATKYSTLVDEPIKAILDDINNSIIRKISENGSTSLTMDQLKDDFAEFSDDPVLRGVTVSRHNEIVDYIISKNPNSTLPGSKDWLALLGGDEPSWRSALFAEEVIVQGQEGYVGGVYRDLLDVSFGGRSNKIIFVDFHELRPTDSEENFLPFFFKNTPENRYARIQEIMAGRNARIKTFYWKVWFGTETPSYESIALNAEIMDRFIIFRKSIRDFAKLVGSTADQYYQAVNGKLAAQMDLGMIVTWKPIIRLLFTKDIDVNFLKLVHLSNTFEMATGAPILKEEGHLEVTAQIDAITVQDSGKVIKVSADIFRDNKPVMRLISQFLFRGNFVDFENTFIRNVKTLAKFDVSCPKAAAVLFSRPWFRPELISIDSHQKSLLFELNTDVHFKSKGVFSSIRTSGHATIDSGSQEKLEVAKVSYEGFDLKENSVVAFFKQHGVPVEQPVKFESPISVRPKEELTFTAPAMNLQYASISGDFNPIHLSSTFASYAGLPGTIVHGMYASAAVRAIIETWVAENNIGNMRKFDISFVGMVLPGQNIEIDLVHTGMVSGRKIITFKAQVKETGVACLSGEAEIEQPSSSYIFTGQGSQEQGMGMELYEKSAAAGSIWDRAESFFLSNYGFSILEVVKTNPKELTVHFGGSRGALIRSNYMRMKYERPGDNGTSHTTRVFQDIAESTMFYTYKSPAGLLAATQFIQPALTIMENAIFADLRARVLVQKDAYFAGHSLGEFVSLTAVAEVMPLECVLPVVFYRGLTMHNFVERDENGRSTYSMCAVNPSKVSNAFDEKALEFTVSKIAKLTGNLLEVVNYNVRNSQYVCAGNILALDCLSDVLDALHKDAKENYRGVVIRSNDAEEDFLVLLICECIQKAAPKPKPLILKRGIATIPLIGIDVPFHSSFLRSSVINLRGYLLQNWDQSYIDPNRLVGRYIPNLTARPFELSKEYFEDVYKLTKSEQIRGILSNWEGKNQTNRSNCSGLD